MRSIAGIAEILDRFDTYFVDQFGVLHDGSRPYPEAVAALKSLRGQGKKVVIISNSGKLSEHNVRRMARIGIPEDCYDRLVTSGEIARSILTGEFKNNASPARYFLIMSGTGKSPLDGLPATQVHDPGDADFVLLAGSEGHRYSLGHYSAILADAAEASIPCICTNPDKIALAPEGATFGPGRIAEIYAEMGGPVRWLGKPYPEIYRFAVDASGTEERDRIVCVGDSIEHDIAGAQGAGLASLLVLGGILQDLAPEEIEDLIARHGARPDYTIPFWRP